jgi:hypothetical protein
MALPPIALGESPLEYLRRTVRPERYPPLVTAGPFDKDGGHLPMTGKTAVKRRLEVEEAERLQRAAVRDARLVRALKWTGCWGG